MLEWMYEKGSEDGWSERAGMLLAEPKFILEGLSKYTQLQTYNLHLPGAEGRHKTQAAAQGRTQT